MRYQKPGQRRKGNVLVMFALILFVLFAMAALVIDLGSAFLARKQMQTAVDNAALEGLRKRDDPTVPEGQRDHARRQAASEEVAWVFDDDLNPADGDPMQFGAGPVVGFTTGVGRANALQTVTRANPPVYKPQRHDDTPGLEMNVPNDTEGDMVAGTFGPNPSYPADATADEDQNYERRDFVASDETTAAGANSFLVRMRGTNNSQGLNDEAGVSTHGPTIPLLFGRGSLISSGESPGGYSVRRDGLTVRATAIADGRRALSAGAPNQQFNLSGITPFALNQTFWNGLTTASVRADQSLAIFAQNNNVGQVIAPQALSVGQTLPPGDLVAYQQFLAQGHYVPIIADSGPLQGRIIGFGFVTVVADAGNPLQAQVTKQTGQIAAENASAVLVNPLDATAAGLAEQLMQANNGLSDPLLAAAIVR